MPGTEDVVESSAVGSARSAVGGESAGPYCGRCGEPLDAPGVDHHACAEALELEPPRYCTVCRRRMVVQVEPTEWFATCSRHGRIDGANATQSGDEVGAHLAEQVPGLAGEPS